MPKLSISHKLVAAIALPLMIQVSFMATYSFLLSESESLAASEARSKELIGHLNWVVGLVSLSMSFASKESANDDATASDCRAQIPGELMAIEKLVSKNKAELESIKSFKDAVTILVSYADSAIRHPSIVASAPTDAAVASTAIPQVSEKKAWGNLFDARSKILAVERNENTRITQTLPKLRAQLSLLINLATAVDVILASAIIYYLGINISMRLGIVSQNAIKFSTGKPLSEPIGGNDELSQLDESFHSMATNVREAERAKQEFVAMLSHDLRTPLSNVLITLDLLLSVQNSSASKAERQRIEAAMESLEQVLSLVNALLHMEKFEAGLMNIDAQDAWTNKVVKTAMSNVGEVAERKEVSVVYTTETDYLLKVDADKIVRVLVNLLSNAIKFSPAKSTVTISTHPKAQTNSVEFKIQDQGRGIPQAEQSKVFDRFKQVERADEQKESGTGLGLAICKAIVESHGGEIGVESEGSNQGACFWFTVPISQKRKTVETGRLTTSDMQAPNVSNIEP